MRTILKGFWGAMIVLMLIAAECSVTQSPPRAGPAMGMPEPPELTMRALLAGTATEVVTFESQGTSELTFTASHTGAWMRLSPRDGVVPVGETQSVEVVADCSLAAPGFNSASLVLSSDDVAAPTRLVRIELTCSDDPEVTSFTVDRAVVEAGRGAHLLSMPLPVDAEPPTAGVRRSPMQPCCPPAPFAEVPAQTIDVTVTV